MPKKITVQSAAAEERWNVKRKVAKLRKRAMLEFTHLPIRAIVASAQELTQQAGEHLIPLPKGDASVARVVDLLHAQYRMEALDEIIVFIEGMAERDAERAGGLGQKQPYLPEPHFKKRR